jgi:predicted metal-binding protein
VNAKPGCPYASADEMASIIEHKTGIPVVKGTRLSLISIPNNADA